LTRPETVSIFSNPGELAIIVVLLVFSGFAWLVDAKKATSCPEGYLIRILTNPETRLHFSAPQSQPLSVKGLAGEMLIEWDEKGRVRIASSSCPCRICQNMGWTDRTSLVCVPNGLILDIIQANDDFDAVAK
jgi:hypothetical protein